MNKNIKTKWLNLCVLNMAAMLLTTCLSGVTLAMDTDVANKQNFCTDTLYQIITDRFCYSDFSNMPGNGASDGTCSNLQLYQGGDWKGIIKKIDYLTDMGINAIWITSPVENITSVLYYPIPGSQEKAASYHGYWPRDFKRHNQAFGSLDDFKSLINKAHSTGIKVIIDFVLNHTSPASAGDPNYRGGEDGILNDDGKTLATYANGVNGGCFHYYGETDFSTFESSIYKNMYDLADLDHSYGPLDTYLKSAIKMWIDLGIDGIRFDAAKHMTFGWQKNLMSYIHSYNPVFCFGEWFLGDNQTDSTCQYQANNSGMSLLNFEVAQKIRDVFRDGTDDMNGLDATMNRVAREFDETNDQVTFIDNHDMARFQVLGANGRSLERALAFILTSPGVPNIYYGTEQYMVGGSDPFNRNRMSSFSTTTPAYKLIKALSALRKSNPAIAYGTLRQRWKNSDVYIYERNFGSNTALIALNRNQTTFIGGLLTALPQGSYTDVLSGLGFDGNAITVNADGSVMPFSLSGGAIAVWQSTPKITTPIIGHVGPMLGKAGNMVTIDGYGFSSTPGSVYVGSTALTGSQITSWSDTQIKATMPNITPNTYSLSVKTSGNMTSNSYGSYELLTGDQVSVRFVVNNAYTQPGESVYLTGDQFELTNWSASKPFGPLFNQVVYQYPTWYIDMSVPASKTIQFKFIKKGGNSTLWESGYNHTYQTPSSGTGLAIVDWQY